VAAFGKLRCTASEEIANLLACGGKFRCISERRLRPDSVEPGLTYRTNDEAALEGGFIVWVRPEVVSSSVDSARQVAVGK